MQSQSSNESVLDWIIQELEDITGQMNALTDNLALLTPDDATRKVTLFTITSEPKVIGFTYRIPYDAHMKFKMKCIEEGWSLQEGISRLIQAYVEGRVSIKN